MTKAFLVAAALFVTMNCSSASADEFSSATPLERTLLGYGGVGVGGFEFSGKPLDPTRKCVGCDSDSESKLKEIVDDFTFSTKRFYEEFRKAVEQKDVGKAAALNYRIAQNEIFKLQAELRMKELELQKAQSQLRNSSCAVPQVTNQSVKQVIEATPGMESTVIGKSRVNPAE